MSKDAKNIITAPRFASFERILWSPSKEKLLNAWTVKVNWMYKPFERKICVCMIWKLNFGYCSILLVEKNVKFPNRIKYLTKQKRGKNRTKSNQIELNQSNLRLNSHKTFNTMNKCGNQLFSFQTEFLMNPLEKKTLSHLFKSWNIYGERQRGKKRRRRPLIVAFEIWGLAWNTNKDANGTMKYKTTEINIFGKAKTILSSTVFYHQFPSTSPKLLFWNELSIRDRFTVIYTVAFDFRSDSITFRRYHKV